MNYEHYRVFFTVGKYKNITRAAEELFSSQPAVTRVIHHMEAELGCQLFLRSKSGVEFTREGKYLYDLLEAPCNQLIRVEHDLKQSVGWQEETVHIGTTATALHCFLFDFLSDFHRDYPHINYRIYTGSSAGSISQLRGGEIDLVFATTPIASVHTLSVTYIERLNDMLVGGKQFAALAGEEVSLADLQGFPFISLPHGMQYRQFCDAFFARCHVDIQPAMVADSSDLIVPMARHNWGLALVPEKMAAEPIQSGELYPIRLREKVPPRHVVMAVDPKKPFSQAVQLMYNAAVKASGQLRSGAS